MNIKLTKKAEEELLKLVANEITKINFTDISVGDGKYTADELLADITSLKSVRIRTKVGNIYEELVGDRSQLFITSTFYNKDIEDKFEVREVGIYAKSTDTDAEYLYAYYIVDADDMAIAIIQDKSTPQYVPISVNSKLSNIDEANITLVDDILVVNQEEFRKYKEEVNEHISDTDNPHSITKSQVGLGNVDNTADTHKPISTAMQNALNLKPNTPNGNLHVVNQPGAFTLPAGGTWFYYYLKYGLYSITSTNENSVVCGIAPGGQWYIGYYLGFAWRIA